MNDTEHAQLQDLQLIPPSHIDSGYAGVWVAKIGSKLDEDWRTAYSDGSGCGSHTAAASHTTSRRAGEEALVTRSEYLGPLMSVADAERAGLALSLEANRDMDMVLLLTDSMTAYQSVLGLARGLPPRSAYETRLKDALKGRAHLDTAISWVRSHIGIPSNEAADRAADWQSHLGPVAGLPTATTHEGLRAYHKAIRKEYRAQPSLGLGRRVLWSRKALLAYTWMRANRGPQRQWLHRIRKTDSPLCPCGETQSGDHITFRCPVHQAARLALLGPTNHTWETLDAPRYDPDDEEDEKTDLVEEFFSYIFAHFS